METETGDGSKGTRPEHFDSADGARTENGMNLRRKYDNVASEATERGQARAGGADGEDGNGASETSEGPRRAEKGDETPQCALPAQESDEGETEASLPPRTVARA